MTKSILNILRVLIIGALAICCVSAQIQPVAIANIPFAFVVADHEMPAGNYTVSFDHHELYILLRGEGKGTAAFALTKATKNLKPSPQGKLVFKRYGDRYFLSQIWAAGNPRGRALQASRLEREEAMNKTQPTLVSLVMAPPGLPNAAR